MKSNIDEKFLIQERKRIGSEIRTRREAKGLSQQQLADEMGISMTTVSKVEAGKWNFGIDTLTSFAIYLDFKLILK